MATSSEEIGLLVHKAIDQLTAIKSSAWLVDAGGNGDSMKDLKNAHSRLKDIVSQLGLTIAEFDRKPV
jgi:hypothetical protein